MVDLKALMSTQEQEHSMDRGIWHLGETDEATVRRLLAEHNRWTGSKRARELLDHWDAARTKFVKVFPKEYQRALAEIHAKKIAAQPVIG
jgi:glutamate synthase (NADPH/NADH) large chain/glutamate synthase (ferredoxin)